MPARPHGFRRHRADRLQDLGRAARLLGDGGKGYAGAPCRAGVSARCARAVPRLRPPPPVHLTRFVELPGHVLLFPLRPPPRPHLRHCLQLVDPAQRVVRGGGAPNRVARDGHPDRVGERLRIRRVERPTVLGSTLDAQVDPAARADGQGVVDVDGFPVAGGFPRADHVAVDDQLDPSHRHHAPHPATHPHLAGSVEVELFPRPSAIDRELDQRAGADERVAVANPLEPSVHGELTVRRAHVRPHRPHQGRRVEAGDRVFAPDHGCANPVAPHGVDRGPAVLGRGPLDRVRGRERGVDDEALGAAEVPIQRVTVVERMDVGGRRPLGLGLQHHVRVARVEALDPGAFVPHRVRRDQVFPLAEHEDMSIEGRAVLLTDDQQAVGFRKGMRAPAREPVLVVEDAVVLVGDLLGDHVLILRVGHHHQVGEAVAQVAGVVHVDVGGTREPALVGEVGDFRERDRHPGGFAGTDDRGGCHGRGFEAAHDGHLGFARRELHGEEARVMKDPVAFAGHAGIGVGGCVELAVGGGQVDPAGH